ncbi:hypothetical protein GGU10DRAFT_436549 [Lentinula aff. detonsa]|uniref:F-box domain-containing protein n=1 Tax=Lentinula aff. detonsa TaxID=2804958 RepID=A0AA38K8Q9_9AGAR|nr:hypothetical protein GGU10DRAFT_436549 [Lentinula aff. detonsa]
MLPEEILHLVVEHLVYNPASAESQLFQLHWKHSRTRLLSLSLVSHQLRRICMPFLFAYVEVRGAYGDLEKLRNQCLESKFFALSISLSKVILDSIRLRTQAPEHDLAKYLRSGMQISSFSACNFSGLCELELWLDASPDLSWLPSFIDAHPFLERIRFSTVLVQWNAHRDVPFILPFIDAVVEEGLNDTLQIKGFSIARTSSSTASSLPAADIYTGWNVAGFWFCFTKWSSGRLLHLTHSFFPQISVLSIEVPMPNLNRTYMDSDEFINSLCRFSSLQTVNFVYLFRGLKFGSSEPCHSLKASQTYQGHLGIRASSHNAARQTVNELEAALICYTSCIAQRMPTVQKFLIQEPPLQGWIHVDRGGTSGTLRPLMQFEMNQLFSSYV